MPEDVYDTGPATNAEFDTTTLRFTYTSLVTPRTVFDEDLDTGERTLLKTTEVLGGHDPADYETGRLWATAPDGTLVPDLLRAPGRPRRTTGRAPCLLYGYGSYEISIDPGFSTLRLSLLDRGFVFAIAHVRGGGEMGRPWYEDGKLLHKRNTFTDFIACAEHLVAEGLTAPDRLVGPRRVGGRAADGRRHQPAARPVRGGRRRGALRRLPHDDPRRDPPAHRHRVGGVGQPRGRPGCVRVHEGLRPYDNVADLAYPTILATAGLNDPRVSYWEPAKWVHRSGRAPPAASRSYLKTEMGAGHQGPSGRYDAWRDEAFVFAFILDALGCLERS